ASVGRGPRLAVADRRRPSHAGARRCRVPRRAVATGARCSGHGTAGSPADAAESHALRHLQRDRRAARDRRLGDPAHCRGGHVGLIDPGHAQCLACALARQERLATGSDRGRSTRASRTPVMNILVYLVPMALALGLTGLAAFLWSLRSGQYEDMDGAALRVLSDDDLATQD